MTNTVVSFTAQNPDITGFRKEKSFYREMSVIDCKDKTSRLNARFYGSGSVVYCVVWAHFPAVAINAKGENIWSTRGGGKAGGGGYHKESAALAIALARAGYVLKDDMNARGDTAMRSGLEAIARHMGLSDFFIHEAHA